MGHRNALIVVFLVLALSSSAHSAANRATLELLQNQYLSRHNTFAEEMEKLAAETESSATPEAAAIIRQFIPRLAEQTLDVDALPGEVQSDNNATVPESERPWRSQLQRIRDAYAQDLYRLSRQALQAQHVSFAFHLVREVAFHDPDHRLARQLLGYTRYEDRWVTPYDQSMLRRGLVWHPVYGWLPASHVDRYENGERFYRGRWMTVEQESAQRHDFKNAWEIESDHFLIKTNQSLERGVELSVALEKFHRFFRREFAAVFNSPSQMRQLFDAGTSGTRLRPQRHEVHYYRSREEFVFRLREKQPGIEISNGLYLPADRTAYFYSTPDPQANIETMFHEVTHQLLSESQPRIFDVAQNANFWLIEGLACYLESFTIHEDGSVSVGDPSHVRMYWARHRRLNENFSIPLAQFTRMGMREFQPPRNGGGAATNEMLQKLYSQATGVTHFLLNYENGVYEDALIEHLAQIYSPEPRIRAKPRPLDELTGVSFQELDRQYLSYLTEMQAALDAQAAAMP